MEDVRGQNLWRLSDLFNRAGVAYTPLQAGFDPLIEHLTVDSREVRTGTCFIAITGTKVDGHSFVKQAVDAGAAVVVVESGCFKESCPIAVEVECTHEAVAKLAAVYFGVDRAQKDGELSVVGVTGTNGKTTVCAIIRSILESAGHRCACLGTISNDVGSQSRRSDMTTLPPIELCAWLAEAAASGVKYAVMEVSSHALDQKRADGIDFSSAVFTNLTQDHLDYHGTLDAYAFTKKRLFDRLRSAASAVICADDDWAEKMAADTRGRVLRYGVNGLASDVWAENISLGDERTSFDLCLGDKREPVSMKLIGIHNVRNVLAAAGATGSLGIPIEDIKKGVEVMDAVRGRLQRVDVQAPYTVFVDYAHTPDALKNVLTLLREVTAERLICVFGCGGDRDRAKRPVMGKIVAELADVAVVTSDNPRSENPQSIVDETVVGMEGADHCERIVEVDRWRAIVAVVEMAEPGDVVLIAGKGHEDYQIIGSERKWFDDVVVAAEAMEHARKVML